MAFQINYGAPPIVVWFILGVFAFVFILLIIMWLIRKSEAKIEISINNYNFSPGDTITGTINMTVKKPVNANGVSASLIGKKIVNNYIRESYDVKGRRTYQAGSPSRGYDVIFEFKQPLDVKKEYLPGNYNYNFQIKIPQNILSSIQNQDSNGVIDTFNKISRPNFGNTSYVSWYIQASLDTSFVGVIKEVQINIG